MLCATPTAGAAGAAGSQALPVGRCINMGDHLEPPTEGAWGRPIADDDFSIIARAGFATVRLPVRWSGHASTKSPFAIDPAFTKRVQHVVKGALAAGLNVIVDDHSFDAIHADPAAHRARLAGLWAQIARSFASEPTAHLWFEIENEPHDKLTNANLRATLAPALAAIRASNPDRPVIVGGEFWSGIRSLATLDLPDDPNIVPTFHYYDPFFFTHQGADWIKPVPPLGRVYGGQADKALLAADVAKVRAYIERTGKTPFIGEFGANEKIPVAQRVAYQKAVREAFDTLGIGMCAWAYANTFPLYNDTTKAWIPGMLDAMGLAK